MCISFKLRWNSGRIIFNFGVVFGVDSGVLFWLFGFDFEGNIEVFVFFKGRNGGKECCVDLGDLGSFFFGERGEYEVGDLFGVFGSFGGKGSGGNVGVGGGGGFFLFGGKGGGFLLGRGGGIGLFKGGSGRVGIDLFWVGFLVFLYFVLILDEVKFVFFVRIFIGEFFVLGFKFCFDLLMIFFIEFLFILFIVLILFLFLNK